MEEKIKIDYNSKSTEGLVEELYHPIHLMYRVRFEDGYENIFFTDVDSGKWLEQDIGFTTLAAVVGEKIAAVYSKSTRIKRKLHWYYLEEEPVPVNFAFYYYKLGSFPVFEIYAPNRRFLFSMILINKDFWQVFRIEGDWDFGRGEELMNRLPEILEEFIVDSGHTDDTA